MKIRSDLKVELLESAGSDRTIAEDALVSSGVTYSEERLAGLIRSLIRQKHGCYDADTEVLTERGWVQWPNVRERDRFLTLNLQNGMLVYQEALHLIQKPVDELLIRVRTQHVDLLVTQDHNMVMSTYLNRGEWALPTLQPAHLLLNRSYRLRLGGGIWGYENGDSDYMRFLGFVIGDGCASGTTLTFRLRRQRKIEYLLTLCARLGYRVSQNNDSYIVGGFTTRVRDILRETYTAARERCIPSQILRSHYDLSALLEGLQAADGHTSATGKETISTVSPVLADQVQELAVKVGRAASIRVDTERSASYGDKPLYTVTLFRDRNSRPRVGWTRDARAQEIQLVPYTGMVYCATVPNGTLYVRRNGKACWSGNSPFESGYMRFLIEAPRAVRDEHVRHRIGSYSSTSLRYRMADEIEVYIPPRHRPLQPTAQHKSMKPDMVPLGLLDYEVYAKTLSDTYQFIEHALNQLSSVPETAATEARRWITPDGLYTPYIYRANPRMIMAFLSLRTHDPDANHVSYPMWEIEQVARQIENYFKQQFPITYAAFNEFGREAP